MYGTRTYKRVRKFPKLFPQFKNFPILCIFGKKVLFTGLPLHYLSLELRSIALSPFSSHACSDGNGERKEKGFETFTLRVQYLHALSLSIILTKGEILARASARNVEEE